MMRVDSLVRLSAPAALVVGTLLVALTAWADYVTGVDVALTLGYLVPVALVSWTAGAGPGLIVSVLSALSWLAVDRMRAAPLDPATQAWDLAMQLGVFVTVAWLLAQLRRRLELESRLAQTDALTGLANRRAFYAVAAREIERLRRHGRPLTVAFLDLDDFKAINDRLGHAAGDELLRRVGQVLSERLRAIDLVARLGGDEFALLLPETRQEQAQRLSADLIARLASAACAEGWPVGVSAGVVTFEVPPNGVDDALRAADDLLYVAKREGKGRACHRTQGAPRPLAVSARR